ncbi:MAG: hypothetical protein HYY23_09610 [Verrucomicrobia bacterium]|nr:hypothetical protein [Verrucomicrobiota bacterium]
MNGRFQRAACSGKILGRVVATTLVAASLVGLFNAGIACAADNAAASPYQKWPRGPSTNSDFFPLAVWLQNPAKAEQYRKAGINTYVGLWRGPTEEQLALLKSADMKVICHQNQLGRRHLDDSTIIGWMHGDEPDNAQSLGQGKGYGPPILPEKIVRDYEAIRAADPSRPVFLNLGQGVAWDNYIGRGVRRNHPEDYPEYVKGCDIASFDIYPAVHEKPDVAGKLWFVAHGVERLVKWSGPERIVWNCLECTRIHHPQKKATPHQVRGEAWMSVIHGSRGLIYFVHEWEPRFNESALLSDPAMLAAVTALNRQITSLAPVLNSPTVSIGVSVQPDKAEVPIAVLTKRHENSLYLFAVGMREGKTTATFTIPKLPGEKTVTVLDENRMITSRDGVFRDTFESWDVHLYRIDAIGGR